MLPYLLAYLGCGALVAMLGELTVTDATKRVRMAAVATEGLWYVLFVEGLALAVVVATWPAFLAGLVRQVSRYGRAGQ